MQNETTTPEEIIDSTDSYPDNCSNKLGAGNSNMLGPEFTTFDVISNPAS